MKQDARIPRESAATPPALAHLLDELALLRTEGLLRSRRAPVEPGAISFCSNDYLGLASASGHHGTPTGAGASRLVDGDREEHLRFETDVARWLGVPSALAFTSGYAANVGLVSALVRPGDLLVSDAMNHASIIDGARLSRAEVRVIPHLDVDAVRSALRTRRTGRAWVVTESYFSMDADGPDLAALRRCCDEADAGLLVDEAHALGVFGPQGRGLCADARVTPDALVGTMGKAFGSGGAFVAGCRPLVDWLWNRARSFVFSTGLSPYLAAASARAIHTAEGTPELRGRLLTATARFRDGLLSLGVAPLGFGPIVPWVLGDADRAMAVAAALRERGVAVQAIRPPSVPQGTARIRFTLTARHTAEDVDRALRAIGEVAACFGP